MKPGGLASVVRWRIRKRFHPLTRIGWTTTKSATNTTQTTVGFAMMFLGWQMKRSTRNALLYRYTAKPGETVRIRVVQGTATLADTTLEA